MLPTERPLLALGADLKNTITLVVEGQAFVSQHLGDLDQSQALRAFEETVEDLISMYDVRWSDLLIAHDCHPQYASTMHAFSLPVIRRCAVQHHRAHVASVLAERGQWDEPVVGVSFDGTGYGDDGAIWGGEMFVGTLRRGFDRVAHLRQAALVGGDAAALYPVQAAAAFLSQLDELPDLTAPPFRFGPRYRGALQLLSRGMRTFPTTSMGRLFDTAAALLGFVRETTYEGQAAISLEQMAHNVPALDAYPFPFEHGELDFRPLLAAMIRDRLRGRPLDEIARAFQLGIAHGLRTSIKMICADNDIHTVVLSGGVFQNGLLLEDLKSLLDLEGIQAWTNHAVPPNDGGISLGQAAIAVFQQNERDGESYA
jgi:hydrogenase maturation protein HypF